MTFEWWYWIVAGLIIAMLELLVPTFFLIWFGAGAIIVGVLMLMFNLSLTTQLVLWAILSIGFTYAWFRFFKNPDHTKAGLSKEAFLGETGLIIKEVSEMKKGEIMFQRPILGSDKWPVIADETIPANEKAKIVDVVGQFLKVSKIDHTNGAK
jgi:hypothetical protein